MDEQDEQIYRREIQESWNIDLYDAFVDPLDAVRGDNGEMWTAIGSGTGAGPTGPGAERHGWRTLAELMIARQQCQRLHEFNAFAIGGSENRVNYIVGTGHTYAVTAKQGATVPDDKIRAVQKVIDDWCLANDWGLRQQENIRRFDRDGEVFLRFFNRNGEIVVRYVMPWQVNEDGSDTQARFGIKTEPDDVETVTGYYVDRELIPADEIQHRKANCDRATLRGQPLFYPVRPALLRADKLLRNMAATSDIQSAIAMIRKHQSATSQVASTFRAQNADATKTDPMTGNTRYVKRYEPGTILDAPAGMEYEFPAQALDASNYVSVLAAILRGISVRLVFPEFMFTADASNGNYASSMVSEGPCIKQFEREQQTQVHYDLQILKRVIDAASESGKLPDGIWDDIQIHVGLPRLQVRDALKDAQVAQINMGLGVLSPQTYCAETEHDIHQEDSNTEAWKKAHPDWQPPMSPPAGNNSEAGDKSGGDTQGGDNKNTAKKTAKKLAKESTDALSVLEGMYP